MLLFLHVGATSPFWVDNGGHPFGGPGRVWRSRRAANSVVEAWPQNARNAAFHLQEIAALIQNIQF